MKCCSLFDMSNLVYITKFIPFYLCWVTVEVSSEKFEVFDTGLTVRDAI
jgi:hypothetical protein